MRSSDLSQRYQFSNHYILPNRLITRVPFQDSQQSPARDEGTQPLERRSRRAKFKEELRQENEAKAAPHTRIQDLEAQESNLRPEIALYN
jgi:hypothetical protein